MISKHSSNFNENSESGNESILLFDKSKVFNFVNLDILSEIFWILLYLTLKNSKLDKLYISSGITEISLFVNVNVSILRKFLI